MDKENEYILQCEAASEIQEKARAYRDSFVYAQKWIGKNGPSYCVCYGGYADYLHDLNVWMGEEHFLPKNRNTLEKVIWLPNQEQLQRILADGEIVSALLLGTMVHKYLAEIPISIASSLSLTQVWLAIVMKERYGKVWEPSSFSWMVI